MWGGLCCVSLAFAYFLVPETKGLTLEQVDRMMEETSPRTSAKWVPHSTFAADMHLAEKHIEIPIGGAPAVQAVDVEAAAQEKA
jgi:hypothetical protein